VFALLLKLTLAPAMVACATLAGRRFGSRVAGWLMGFPIVAGPVLWFYAHEQGAPFAAHAAAGALLGMLSLCLFLVVYAWAALRFRWWKCVLLGWAAFTAGNLALAASSPVAEAPWPVGLLAAFAALALTRRLLPRRVADLGPPGRDLLPRVLATAVLVVSLTAVAHVLGPTLSGLFTPFPVATTILVVFAHREGGPGAVVAVYGGFIPSLFSFSSCCAAISWGLAKGGGHVAIPFAVALLISVGVQAMVLVSLRRQR